MTRSQTWVTPAALAWLQTILLERFGYCFRIMVSEGSRLELMLDGHVDYSISLVVDGNNFSCSDSTLPFTRWHAAAEGWSSALVADSLPAPGATELPAPLITATPQGFHIGYDILGLTYWMLTRQEEIGRTDLDEFGRFPATSSHAFRHGYLECPIVDEWLHVLGQVIQQAWPALPLKACHFSMQVSHDVDRPSRYAFCGLGGIVRAMAGDVIKRRDFKSALFAPWVAMNSNAKLHSADPANTFDWIMDMSERHSLKSAFYFICGRTDASKDADYEPEHPAIRHLMCHIHARGHEIGLHPSYGSYQKPEVIAAEAQRLRRVAHEEGIIQAVWGGRMHYLRWQQPMTLQAWSDAGMDYDATLGYADRPGFRCGTCFEYPAFNPITQQTLKLRIRPLIVMEGTVMTSVTISRGARDDAHAKFFELKAACKAVGGCFSLLWHNSQLLRPSERELYKNILCA